MTPPSRRAASTRSRDLANTAFRKVTPRASRIWSMSRPGLSASPGGLRRSPPQLATDGLLRPGPDRARCAREHGVEVRPVDVSFSSWDFDAGTVLAPRERGEERGPTRKRWDRRGATGLLQEAKPGCPSSPRCSSNGSLLLPLVRGRRQALRPAPGASRSRRAQGRGCGIAAAIPLAGQAAFDRGIPRLRRSRPALEKLAAADCFRSLGLDRRQALWEVKALAKSRRCRSSPSLTRASRGGAFRGAARNAVARACGERLPDAEAVAQGASDALPPPPVR